MVTIIYLPLIMVIISIIYTDMVNDYNELSLYLFTIFTIIMVMKYNNNNNHDLGYH